MSGALVELSHPLVDGMPAYPGFPSPRVEPLLTHDESHAHYAPGTEFSLTRIELVGNTGTYLDSPYHRYRDGADIAALPLQSLVDLPAVVVDGVPGDDRCIELAVDPAHVSGCAVLVRTGWDRRWGTDAYYEPGPFLATTTAAALAAAGAALVGVDFWNVDDAVPQGARPVHSVLLAAGVLVVEHLCGLDALPAAGAVFSAVPLAVVGAASLPVRAWARLPA